MSTWNVVGDVLALGACLVAWSYVFGIWRMVRSPSRLVLLGTITYMLVSRLLVLFVELDEKSSWIEDHRSLVILPVYFLLAIAFGMTYYELRTFHFDKRLEDGED